MATYNKNIRLGKIEFEIRCIFRKENITTEDVKRANRLYKLHEKMLKQQICT